MPQRDKRIDSIRGILLVLMTINHFGGPVSRVTYQISGYVSAAEGFIFLSGFVFSVVYMRHISNAVLLINKSLSRAFIIYKYHLALAVILLLLSYLRPSFRIYWSGWLGSFYYTNPFIYMKNVMLLLHQPNYLDILPMYTVFVIFSPAILIALKKGMEKLVILVSLIFWLFGQYTDPINSLSNFVCQECRPGYFNIMSWQIIWVMGIYLGFMRYSNKSLQIVKYRLFIYTACTMTVVLFLSRHNVLPIGFDTISATNRANLAWLRLLNFFVLVITIWFLIRKIPVDKSIPWVGFIGKYSLQVFSYHILLLYILRPVSLRLINSGSQIGYVIYTVLIVISLTIPAVVYKDYRNAVSVEGV